MASISLEARDKLVALYIGMFNAAPGAANLSTMVQAYEGGKTLKQIAEDFDNADFRKQYPAFLTAEEFADRLVNRFLGSEAGAAQKTWATNWIITKLGNGVSDTDIIVEAVNALLATNNPAYDGSKAALNNKVTVANYYSVTLEQSGDSLAALQAVISGVTSDSTTVDAAKQAADDAQTAANSQTFTLTTGADTTLVGGTGNDTYVAAVGTAGLIANGTTLGAGDNLKGGDGADTLDVAISGSANGAVTVAAVSMSGVETVKVSNYDVDVNQANTHTLDLSQATGVTTISLAGSSANGDTLFTNIGAIVDASMANGSGDLSLGYTAAANSSLTDAQNLTLDNVTAATFDANGITTLNLNSNSGTANSLDLGASSSFSAVTITGSSNLTLTESQTNTLKTVDASAFTGKLSLTTNDVTNVNITGGSAADTINLGGTLTSLDTIDGGEGADVLSVSSAVTSASLTNVSNVETLTVTGATNVSLTKDASTTTINATDAGANAITLGTGMTSAMSVLIGTGDSVVNTANVGLSVTAGSGAALNGSTVTGGTGADSITVTADSTTVAFTNITGVETVTVADSLVAGNDLTLNLGAYATAITIDGTALDSGIAAASENLTVDGSTATKVITINAGAGADTLTGGSANDVIDGGDGNDSINGSAGGNDSISGGAGNDTINMAAAMTAADTIDGGEGTDTLSVTSLSAAALANVTNVEVLSLSGAASTATLTSNLSFTSIDMASVDNNAQTLTLSTGYTNATSASVDAGDKVVNSANVALTVNATAADLEAADGTTLTGGTGTDTLNVTADNTTANIVATSGLITGFDSIVVVDGGDSTVTGFVTAGKDITIDLTSYAASTDRLTVDASALDSGTLSGFTLLHDEVLTITGTSARALNVIGGGGADTIVGSSHATIGDIIDGGAGNDTVTMAGNLSYLDTLTGGAGTDTLSTSAAMNDIDFQNVSGFETLTLGSTATLSSLFDATGVTTINVSGANAVDASGTQNAHTFANTAAANVNIKAGLGDDTFSFKAAATVTAADTIDGSAGNDTVILLNDAAVTATIDFDAITKVETVKLGSGVGALATTAETVALTVDVLTATTAQTINLDASGITDSKDTVAITNNAATTTTKFNITGGAGADTLTGSSAADTISGGAGNDVITGGLGADNLTGGAGNDSFVYAVDKAMTSLPSNNANADTITDFAKLNDSIDITLTTSGQVNTKYVGAAASNAEALSLLSSSSGEFFFNTTTKQLVMDVNGDGLLQANDLYITLTGLEDLTSTTVNITLVSAGAITGSSGNDIFDVTGVSNFSIDGLAGNDTFNATQATLDTSDTLVGGAGTDTLNIAGAGTTTLSTDANIATIEVINQTGTAAQTLNLTGQTEAFTVNLNNSGSAVTVNADVAYKITGGSGADTITVNTVNAHALLGVTGATIAGGAGSDTLALGLATTTLVDADFANVSSIESLTLTGASTVVLGANATATGITTVTTGTGATDITSASALTVNATAVADGTALAYAGTGPAIITGLQGDLTYTGTGATLSVSLASVATTTVTANATTSAVGINGDALTDGQVLTLAGSGTGVATVSLVAGDITASTYSGTSVIVAATTGTNSIITGAGADTIGAGTGADTIIAGGGADAISLGGADTAVDLVRFAAITDGAAADALVNADVITGFSGNGADGDTIQFANGVLAALVGGGGNGQTITSVAASGTGDFNAANGGVYVFADAVAAGQLADATAVATAANTGGAAFANVAAGETAILVLNDGTDTAIYYFVDADANQTVDAADTLTLLGTVTGAVLVAADLGNY